MAPPRAPRGSLQPGWGRRGSPPPDLAALDDAPRSGRPARIPIEAHFELVKIACDRPDGDKAPFQQIWTLKTLADALAKQTGVRMSRTEVWRILRGADLRPHRVRMWLHSPDPDFRSKVARICKLYLKPPEGATVLCTDDKPGMQAIEERFPLRPCAPGRAARKEFEYRRRGTRTLIASFNIRTGEVLAHCGPTRTAKDLLAHIGLETTGGRHRPRARVGKLVPALPSSGMSEPSHRS
jgi:hypothetical protein